MRTTRMPRRLPAPRRALAVNEPGMPVPGYRYVEPVVPIQGAIRIPDREEDQFTRYQRILKERKWAVIAVAVISAAAGFALATIQPRMYRARTLLEIESLNADFLNIRNVNPTAPSSSSSPPEYNIRTQVTVLQSRPVLERAVAKGDLTARLSRRSPSSLSWLTGTAPAPTDPAVQKDLAMQAAAAGIKVRSEPNSRILELIFEFSDASAASDMANAIATSFIESSLDNRLQNSRETSAWLSKQLLDVKKHLEDAELQARSFAKGSSLTFLSDKDNIAEDRLRQVQQELSRAQAERVEKQAKYEQAATTTPESLPQVLEDSILRDYQAQLTTLRRQLAELTSSFTSEHPKVLKVKAEIATVEHAFNLKVSDILARIRNEYEAAGRREKMLIRDYSAQVGLMSRQSDKIAHYSMLKSEVENTRQLYDLMTQRVKEAGLASAMRASDIHIVEAAARPSAPFKPSRVLNSFVGLLIGLCAGAGLILASAKSETLVRDPGELARRLDVPELGVIPKVQLRGSAMGALLDRCGLFPNSDRADRVELTTWHEWPSAMAESIRLTLISILLSEVQGRAPRVIAVSSARPGEGKSTISSNLAIGLAQIKRKTLVIDADMRKPRQHHIFSVDNSSGLTDCLAGGTTVPVSATEIPNLFVLPSGRTANERLLFNAGLGELLAKLKREFDMIVIDTPPLLPMSDARLVAHRADAVILVVGQYTEMEAVAAAKHRLNEDGSRLLGTILNNWDCKESSSPYRKYYGEMYR